MKIESIKKALLQQKRINLKGGLYHQTQLMFSYHTNAIEGSTISEDETEQLYTTGAILTDGEKPIVMKEAKETQNHFELFKYILDTVEEPINEEMMKKIHYLLKDGTYTEAEKKDYKVGGYKTRTNAIGVLDRWPTTTPKEVPIAMKDLLGEYEKIKIKTLENIIDFHVKFERIHPFSDGNGRVGRAIMFRECLHHNIMPFVIELRNKPFYMKGIKEYRQGKKERLLETCLNSQDNYAKMCEFFLEGIDE